MNAVYVPGYTLEDQRAGRPMTIAQALDIAELASPNPWSAAHALRTLRRALEQASTTLSEVRDAAGAECTYPFADLPQMVAALRKAGIAIPAVLSHTRCSCTQRGPDLFCSKCSGALFDLPDAPAVIAPDDTTALRAFAQDVLRSWPEFGDVDGGELQEIAIRHGLLALKDPLPTEPCCEHCMCAEYADPKEFAQGVQCYRRTPVLTGGAA